MLDNLILTKSQPLLEGNLLKTVQLKRVKASDQK